MSAQALTDFPTAAVQHGERSGAAAGSEAGPGVVRTLTDPSRTATALRWVNVRGGPDVRAASVDSLDPGQATTVVCWVTGSTVAGPGGTTDRWDRLGDGRYVSHAFLDGPADHVPCEETPAVAPPEAPQPPPGVGRNRIA
ncbi:hypothetical protein [Virgisporangium aliadipatigenens]|nr:hypothetical protein [Virgisporangium aliadipatigenens]